MTWFHDQSQESCSWNGFPSWYRISEVKVALEITSPILFTNEKNEIEKYLFHQPTISSYWECIFLALSQVVGPVVEIH